MSSEHKDEQHGAKNFTGSNDSTSTQNESMI